ncbi:hypothetical protein GBW32_00255 [Streptomyces tsukubensis]|uniref:hypothetical protein n=1 Tax=Streptomyces tsukubensis TaxID=83656 RepID=UPI001265EC92|nr:hypothetical protein [Streptomyces tsukubensis]QFR91766.1 hypothetical protein GBW32_00255 [Streptomyces tsukubensis]
MLTEGAHQGDLYSLDQDEGTVGTLVDIGDVLVLPGLLVTLTGLSAGGVTAVRPGDGGASRAIVRQANQLRESAARVRADHLRATEAVVVAWTPLHEARVRAALDRLPVRTLPHASGLRHEGLDTMDAVREAAARTPGRLPGLGRQVTEEVLTALAHTTARACDQAAVHLDAEHPTSWSRPRNAPPHVPCTVSSPRPDRTTSPGASRSPRWTCCAAPTPTPKASPPWRTSCAAPPRTTRCSKRRPARPTGVARTEPLRET